jgi:prolyl oligopeptidase
MRKHVPRSILALGAAAALAGCSGQTAVHREQALPAPAQDATRGAPGLSYPESRRGEQVDDYHGTLVADPYRWLEDTDSPETKRWVEAQNRVSFAYLEKLPAREPLKQRLTELWNYEKFSAPFKRGGNYFFYRNSGLQNQSVLYVQPSLTAEPRVLIDPNTLSSDGTVALTTISPSEDGRLLVYGTASGGSDWQEFRVRDVATGQDRPDVLKWLKFSGAAWTHDNQGFFYSRYPEPTGNALTAASKGHKLYYHRLGTPQSEDALIWERPDQPEWYVSGSVTDDGRYLRININQGTDPRNRVLVLDLVDAQQPRLTGKAVELLQPNAAYGFVGNDGPIFYFRTDKDAPRGRVVAIDTRRPAATAWRTLIPEGEDVLEGVTMVNDQFVARYLHDAASRLRIHALDGKVLREVELPTLGSLGGISGERADTEMFYTFTSFLYPSTIFRYDFATGKSSIFRQPKLAGFDPSQYETVQLFYPSKDGTRVPMFVTYKKGIKLDGTNPTLLYGYGGFNINVTPSFSVSNLAWLEKGGIYAVPSLRGGSEYGEAWHQAGMREKKQNVFDDFIAAGEHLIREGYTSPKKLAVSGGSNGGLLVGAVVNQRPDLFGAALPAVGVMDMLRYHKFTVGWGWVPEYGSADDAAMFPVLHAYSPLHNIRAGTRYPATLVTTADHDDRVVPGHSFKYTAALQQAQAGDGPVLIRIETRAGHGAGKPTSKQIEEAADKLAFLAENLGM